MSEAVDRVAGESVRIVRWAAGECHGLVWANGMALLDGALSLDAVTGIWEATTRHLDLAGFLEELSRASGARILSIPAFAVAIADEDAWHVAARGPFEVRAECGGTTQEVRGSGVSTWSERLLDGVCAVTLTHVAAGVEAGEERPILGGVVPAGRLRWGVAGGDVAPPPALGAVAEPVVREEAPDPFATLMPDADDSDADDSDADSDSEDSADAAPEPGPAPEPHSEPALPPQPGSFAHLWGDTVMPSVTEAAVRDTDGVAENVASGDFIVGAPRPGASTPLPTEQVDLSAFVDHDGQTVMASSLGVAPAMSPMSAASGAGGTVLGIVCGQGHANPPQRTRCRVCGVPVSGDPKPLPRPALGWLRSTTGEVVELSTPVIAGRNPRAERVQGPQLPRLLALPHSHISGNHLEIRLEGWNVLAVDLHSTNGTFLRRHGEPPVRLPESPVLLIEGDVLDLGHGVQLALEQVP